MEYILFFIIVFIIINISYYIFVIRKERALTNMKKSKEVLLLGKINKIDITKYEIKKVVKLLGCSNAFIVAFLGTIVLLLTKLIKNFYLWILICSIGAIIVLIPLILIIYKIVGSILKKEGK